MRSRQNRLSHNASGCYLRSHNSWKSTRSLRPGVTLWEIKTSASDSFEIKEHDSWNIHEIILLCFLQQNHERWKNRTRQHIAWQKTRLNGHIISSSLYWIILHRLCGVMDIEWQFYKDVPDPPIHHIMTSAAMNVSLPKKKHVPKWQETSNPHRLWFKLHTRGQWNGSWQCDPVSLYTHRPPVLLTAAETLSFLIFWGNVRSFTGTFFKKKHENKICFWTKYTVMEEKISNTEEEFQNI